MPTTQTLLLTVSDACRELAISRAHLYRLIERGEIEAAHIGRLIRIPRRSLEAYVERLTRHEGVRRDCRDTEAAGCEPGGLGVM